MTGSARCSAKALVLRDALALAFMVAVQEAIDIAYHIVADEGWGIPDSHRGAFDLLAARRVVTPHLATELSAAPSMRNRIAHGYASVDHQRSWHELPGESERSKSSRPRSLPGSRHQKVPEAPVRVASFLRTALASVIAVHQGRRPKGLRLP